MKNRQYHFKVAGFYDKSLSLSVFMPLEDFRTAFALEADAFSGYLSDSVITDIAEDKIATVITLRDITKNVRPARSLHGRIYAVFSGAVHPLVGGHALSAHENHDRENENAISMVKILGYENREIAALYLHSNT